MLEFFYPKTLVSGQSLPCRAGSSQPCRRKPVQSSPRKRWVSSGQPKINQVVAEVWSKQIPFSALAVALHAGRQRQLCEIRDWQECEKVWVCHLKIVSTDLNEMREFPGWSSLSKRNATITSSRKGIMKWGKTGVSLTILTNFTRLKKAVILSLLCLGK